MYWLNCCRGLSPNAFQFPSPPLVPHTSIPVSSPSSNPLLVTTTPTLNLRLLEAPSHLHFHLMLLDVENTEKDDTDDYTEEDGVGHGSHEENDKGGEDVWIHAVLRGVSFDWRVMSDWRSEKARTKLVCRSGDILVSVAACRYCDWVGNDLVR